MGRARETGEPFNFKARLAVTLVIPFLLVFTHINKWLPFEQMDRSKALHLGHGSTEGKASM